MSEEAPLKAISGWDGYISDHYYTKSTFGSVWEHTALLAVVIVYTWYKNTLNGALECVQNQLQIIWGCCPWEATAMH